MFLLQTKSPPSDAPRIPDPHTSIDSTQNESTRASLMFAQVEIKTFLDCNDVGEIDEMIQIIDEIKLSGIMKSHNLKLIKNTSNFFTGQDLLAWLYEEKHLGIHVGTFPLIIIGWKVYSFLDNETSLDVGQKLINRHLLHDVNHNIDETFRPNRIYRLLEDECHDALNIRNGSKTLPLPCKKLLTNLDAFKNFFLSSKVLIRFCEMLQLTVSANRSWNFDDYILVCHFEEIFRQSITDLFNAGKNVSGKSFFDYQKISTLSNFETYLNVITQMQRINFINSDFNERLAFFINVYNALVIHGKIEFGYPNTAWQRYKVYKNYDLNKCTLL